MLSPAIQIFLTSLALRLVASNVPAATIRSSFIRIADTSNEAPSYEDLSGRSYEDVNRKIYYGEPNRRNNEIEPRGYSYEPRKSYVIYDGDVNSLPGARERPQLYSGTRPWHMEFNKRRLAQGSHQIPTLAYHSVYSNLIQVFDPPSQKKYYQPYDGKHYVEPERMHQMYSSVRPVDIPKYDVVYPYESQAKNVYYSEKLPESFPTPFKPNANFDFKNSPPVESHRKDSGLFPTQTVNYSPYDTSGEKRGSRKDRCNYFRVNDKGFPVGNEMCGRAISDILLAPDFPTTGELVLEHRKRYRGSYQDHRQEVTGINHLNRRRRSADDGSAFYGSTYYSPRSSCCGGNMYGSGYGLRPYYGYQNNRYYGYDNTGSGSRPYYGDPGSYGGYEYNEGGQYYGDNRDDVGEETSDNRGLASYMKSRGRGDRGRFRDSDEDSNSEEESGKISGSRGGRGDEVNYSQNSKYNTNSRNNFKHQTNRGSSDNRSQSNYKSNNNRRNLNNSNRDSNGETYGQRSSGNGFYSDNSSDGYYNINGGNNYGYLRNHDSRSSSDTNYRGMGAGTYDNVGGGSYGNWGRGHSGYGYGYSS